MPALPNLDCPNSPASFNRAVGQVESLVEKAIEIGQFWLRGVSVARALAAKVAGAS